MKNLFYLFLLISITSCSQTPAEKAEEVVDNFMKEDYLKHKEYNLEMKKTSEGFKDYTDVSEIKATEVSAIEFYNKILSIQQEEVNWRRKGIEDFKSKYKVRHDPLGEKWQIEIDSFLVEIKKTKEMIPKLNKADKHFIVKVSLSDRFSRMEQEVLVSKDFEIIIPYKRR